MLNDARLLYSEGRRLQLVTTEIDFPVLPLQRSYTKLGNTCFFSKALQIGGMLKWKEKIKHMRQVCECLRTAYIVCRGFDFDKWKCIRAFPVTE
jgi:hypothetical protein